MNAVAFSLYRPEPKYTEGILRNAELMPTIYPGWEMHVWVDWDVPQAVVVRLYSLHATVHEMDGNFTNRMFYRFLIHDEPDVERYLIRDADSRVSPREAWCVQEWLKAGTLLHTIHDHPHHIKPIQGGLFGVWRSKDNRIPNMGKLIVDGGWADLDKWGQDEAFLEKAVWPRYQDSFTEHGRSKDIPIQNTDPDSFCGEIVDEKETPRAESRQIRKAKSG